jgi:HSP20 family protein
MELHRTMDRVFNDAFGQSGGTERGQAPRLFLPVDVREAADGYTITAPVPGFQPEEIDVTFTEGVLTLKAEHKERGGAPQGTYLRREVAYGNLFRQIGLPGDVKTDEIEASVEQGMLTVNIPKMPRPEPKRIPIGGSKAGEKQLVGEKA